MTNDTPTDRELEALKVLWEHGHATVRQICDSINARGEDLAYTTVLSLLQVMEQKGFVKHERVGKAYRYSATVEREGTFRSLAGQFLNRVFDGALDEYVVHALQSRRIDANELRRLEALIEHEKQKRSRRKQRKGRQK